MVLNQHGWPSAGPVIEHDKSKRPTSGSCSARRGGRSSGKVPARKGHPKNLNSTTLHFVNANLDASVLPREIPATGFGVCVDAVCGRRYLPSDLVVAQEYSTGSAHELENGPNALGYMLLGVLVGTLAAAGSLFLGASIAVALGVYCAVGASVTLIWPLLTLR